MILGETDPEARAFPPFIGTSHATWQWLWLVQQLYVAPHSSPIRGALASVAIMVFPYFSYNIQQLQVCVQRLANFYFFG